MSDDDSINSINSSDWLWVNIAIISISVFYFTIKTLENRIVEEDERGDVNKQFTKIFGDSFFSVFKTLFKVYLVLVLFKYLVFPSFSILVYILFGPNKVQELDIKFILSNFFAFEIFTHMVTEFMFISFTVFIIIFVIILYIIFCFNECNFDNYFLHYKIIIYISMAIFLTVYTSYSFRRSSS